MQKEPHKEEYHQLNPRHLFLAPSRQNQASNPSGGREQLKYERESQKQCNMCLGLEDATNQQT
jgi:hypothetical protein